MRRIFLVLAASALLAGGLALVLDPADRPSPQASAAASLQPGDVLILHDSGGPFGHVGSEFAVLLRNLIGHFDLATFAKPVTSYRRGDIATARATFYIGSSSDEPSKYPDGSPERTAYRSFVEEVARADKPVVWMGDNLQHLAWSWDPAWGTAKFEDRFGFTFDGPDQNGWNRVLYKETELLKGVIARPKGALPAGCAPDTEGRVACAQSLSLMTVRDEALARAHAFAVASQSKRSSAYVVKGRNLWVVADLPFPYLSEEDRYLAFADLLHDMLEVPHEEEHRAIARIEDVSAATPAQDLEEIGAVFADARIPFGLAVIPIYRDVSGEADTGLPTTLRVGDSEAAPVLKRLIATQQADIVQHGTAHMWEGGKNPDSGITSDDFEFYRVLKKPDGGNDFVGPVPEDSPKWARDLILTGRAEFERAGLKAFAWEAPHYAASWNAYTAIREVYPIHWGRAIYFTAPDSKRFLPQFFPYTVVDVFGQKIVPESLGDIEPPAPGFAGVQPEDLVRRATKLRVVRDAYAGFFFHPFLDPADLAETVRGIKDAGFTFVRPCSVWEACATP